jgi:hypothetical protein
MDKTAKNEAYEASNKNKSAAKAGAGEKHVEISLLTPISGGEISVEDPSPVLAAGARFEVVISPVHIDREHYERFPEQDAEFLAACKAR